MRLSLAFIAIAGLAAASAKLIGITEQVGLESIDPSTGKGTAIGSDVPYELQAQGLSAVDTANGVYYILGFNRSSTKPNLVGLKISTGAVVTDVPLPFAESAFVGVGQSLDVDPSDGNIFAGGQLETGGPHVVGKLDVTSGHFSPIASLNSSLIPVLGGASTFDPDSRQLFVQLGERATGQISNYAVDVDNHKVTVIPEDPEAGRVITTLAYDSKRKLVLGLGVKPFNGTIERTLVTLDPTTKVIATVASVKGWLIESGGESALDSSARTLFWIGQKEGAKPTDPFSLIGLDADTGATKSSPDLCPNDAACPWSIGVF